MQETHCKRCGKCCLKGGPLLHAEDLHLLAHGKLGYGELLTLRKGELIHDPVRDQLLPLEDEVIKIAGRNSSKHPWHCVLHTAQGCGLHPLRPAQCAALFCMDTHQLEHMYIEDRLKREDIFDALILQEDALMRLQDHVNNEYMSTEGWTELARAHEEECALPPLVEFAQTAFLRNEWDMELMDKAEIVQIAEKKILDCVRYDLNFRDLCTQKAGISAELLPCLLGRPVHVFLRSLGIKIYEDKYGELAIHFTKKGVYFSVLQAYKDV